MCELRHVMFNIEQFNVTGWDKFICISSSTLKLQEYSKIADQQTWFTRKLPKSFRNYKRFLYTVSFHLRNQLFHLYCDMLNPLILSITLICLFVLLQKSVDMICVAEPNMQFALIKISIFRIPGLSLYKKAYPLYSIDVHSQ